MAQPLERFPAKWIPVRVKKTRQNKKESLRSDSIGTEKALSRRPASAGNRPDDARTRIVAAALKELVDGDGDFEIGDVARRARVSVGLAYHYFGSKAGLISALIKDFHDRHEAVVDQHFDS